MQTEGGRRGSEMKITTKMLLTRYFERNPDSVASYKSDLRAFNGIRLLPAEGSGQKPLELPSSFLYVTDCTDLSYLSRFDSGVHMISFSDDPPKKPDLSACIFVKTDQCLAFCFNELQACFDEFAGWEQALHEAVMRQTSFQELLEISNTIIPSAMLIYDPALKLLAWSRSHEQLDDPIFQNAVRDGFLNADAVRYFEQTHAFENMNSRGTSAGESDSFHKHADYLRSVRINDQLAVYAILLHTSGLSRSYEQQLFDILCDTFREFLKKQYSTFIKDRSVTDYFLMDLLDNPDTSAEKIRDRLYYHDLNYDGCYVVSLIHSDVRQKTSEHFFLETLRNSMINARIFSYEENIVVLYEISPSVLKTYRDTMLSVMSRIMREFPNNIFQIACSRPFSEMVLFSSAYLQAKNALYLAARSEDSHSSGNENICFYEDYWVQDLFYQNIEKNKSFFYCEPCISDLYFRNTEKGWQQLAILREYLYSGRNYTNAAEKLGMHRNNVIYHIQKLEEQYAIDLSDTQTYLRMLLSLETLRFDN